MVQLRSLHRRTERVLLVKHYPQPVRGPVAVQVTSHAEPVRIDGIIAER